MKFNSAMAALLMGIVVMVLAAAQPATAPGAIVSMELPLKFPVVGNVAAVKQWRFGRLQDVEQTSGTDIILGIRTNQGLVRVVGPGPQLSDLAFQSDWVRTPTRSFPGRSDYAERMIAFDFDANNRLIALASLEPVFRDRNRLRRAIGP
jgi:hypothetical protein